MGARVGGSEGRWQGGGGNARRRGGGSEEDRGSETVAARPWQRDRGSETVAARSWQRDRDSEIVVARRWQQEMVAARRWQRGGVSETVAARCRDRGSELVATELVATEMVATDLVATELMATELMATELVTELVAPELVAPELVATEPEPGADRRKRRLDGVPVLDFFRRAKRKETSISESHRNSCCWGRGSGSSRVLFSFFNVVSCPPAQRAHAQAGARGGYNSITVRAGNNR